MDSSKEQIRKVRDINQFISNKYNNGLVLYILNHISVLSNVGAEIMTQNKYILKQFKLTILRTIHIYNQIKRNT